MEHLTIEEAEEMPETDLRNLIEEIVTDKFTAFRADLKLELLPIRMQLQSHEEQMAEVRASTSALASTVSSEAGKAQAFREEQRENHATNTAKDDLILQKLNLHLGEHDGADHAEIRSDRKVQRFREWLKVGGGFISLGAIVGWAITWGKHMWAKFHTPH